VKNRALASLLFVIVVSSLTFGQGSTGGGLGVGYGQSNPFAAGMGAPGGNIPFDSSLLNSTMLNRQAERDLSPLENPAISVSKLDLKAPGKARHEYDKGSQFLSRKAYQDAVIHLSEAISIYPDFVAAHNALGTSYLNLGQNDQARDEFAKAVSLDDHIPISYMNLGCAQLALKNYSAAEESVKKASAIAPMDMQVLTALGYAQLMNHDYSGVIDTMHQVHTKKHKDAAIIHYYAASAYDNLSDLSQAQRELEIFLREDPKSPAADAARDILLHLHDPIVEVKQAAVAAPVFTEAPSAKTAPAPGQLPEQMRKILQESKEKQQIAEAEAMCDGCEEASAPDANASAPSARKEGVSRNGSGFVLRHSVDEVALLFAATNHGESVPDLTRSDVQIRDDRRPPTAITGFLSESELPLRMGIVIDTSESITNRFAFEQKAATNFLDKVVTDKKDLAFVVGFSNSILLTQDFTADQTLLNKGIYELAPGGGTALWDAVAFAAGKLSDDKESKPVARILVVISDGEDNSSSTSLKEAIETAEHGEVLIYTVSTRDNRDLATNFASSTYSPDAVVGDKALKVLAENTGGAAFFPGSLGSLNHSLNDLQQVIRGRYLISYRPAEFKRDGKYHAVNIAVTKSGHKLHVYARKGYYARLSDNTNGGS